MSEISATASAAAAAWDRDEQVISVDADDNETGPVSRTEAHGPGCRLHRAFSVLLIDDEGRLLLCRRSVHKRLWPLHWADSCAGHPRPGETVLAAAERRVAEELGCAATLHPIGSFTYRASFADAGWECELCHAFVGRLCDVSPDPAEIAEVGLFALQDLLVRAGEPDGLAPWLVECLRTFPASSFAAPL